MIYFLSKVFTYLILPPGGFILLFFIALFFIKKYRKFFLFCVFFFYLLSNNYIANMLLSPLETPYNRPLSFHKDAAGVVVLGGGKTKGASNLPLSADAFKRAVYGLMIAKKEKLPLIFTGGGIDKNYSESQAFLETAGELSSSFGIKLNKKNIFIESKSLNTYQNAKYTRKVFEKMGIKKPIVYLVTSAYHMRRALIIFKKLDFKVIPAATDFKIDRRKYNFYDLLPKMGAFRKSYIALHEYFGILSIKLLH